SKHVKKRLLSHMNSQNYRVGEKALCLATVNRRLPPDRYASPIERPAAFNGPAGCCGFEALLFQAFDKALSDMIR
ncbi:hypothetical protein ACFFT4_04890, partial [Cohnella cellulosilytica]